MKNLIKHSIETTRPQVSSDAWGCLIMFTNYRVFGGCGDKDD